MFYRHLIRQTLRLCIRLPDKHLNMKNFSSFSELSHSRLSLYRIEHLLLNFRSKIFIFLEQKLKHIFKETVRTIEQISQKQTKQVLDWLWKEYNHRAAYVRYLVRARQKLLGALAHIKVYLIIICHMNIISIQ